MYGTEVQYVKEGHKIENIVLTTHLLLDSEGPRMRRNKEKATVRRKGGEGHSEEK